DHQQPQGRNGRPIAVGGDRNDLPAVGGSAATRRRRGGIERGDAMTRRILVITAVALLSLGATRDYSRRSNSGSTSSGRSSSGSSSRPSSSSTRPARTQGYSERYDLLEERNIFLRDRAHRPTTRDSASTQPA